MNKKVISSVLAGAMAVSTLGVVASAADSKNTYNAKAELMDAKISANVPSDLEASINPYGATVKKTVSATEVAIGYADGIISPTYAIENLDNTAGIKVSATATITGSSTVAVMTKPMDDAKLAKATDKQVFAFLNTTTFATGTIADANLGSLQPVFGETKYVANDNQLAFTEDGASKSGIMTIGKATAAGTADAGAIGYFYVGGQCTPNPEEAWTNKDTVTVDLVLDLSPSMGDPADLTLKKIEITGGAKITFDPATKAYEVAAKDSATKAATIVATANDTTAKVYVKYAGKLVNAAAGKVDASATSIGVTAITNGSVTITPQTSTDYSGALEIIVVSASTFESSTYTINFTTV